MTDPATAPRLTDERLAEIERDARDSIESNTCAAPGCSEIEPEELLVLIEASKPRTDNTDWVQACAQEIAEDPDCCDIQSSDAGVIADTIIQHHARARCGLNCPSCGRALAPTMMDDVLGDGEVWAWACPKHCPPPPAPEKP